MVGRYPHACIVLIGIILMYTDRECRIHRKGSYYIGTTSRTISGHQCQTWSEDVPHPHGFKLHKVFREGHAHHAHCRNPLTSHTSPWCFTTNSSVRYEECNVPLCREYIECWHLTFSSWSHVVYNVSCSVV